MHHSFFRSFVSVVSAVLILVDGVLANDEGYLLKAGDSIMMKVFNEAELDTETQILRTGEVSFPLIGSIALSLGLLKKKWTCGIQMLISCTLDRLIEISS